MIHEGHEGMRGGGGRDGMNSQCMSFQLHTQDRFAEGRFLPLIDSLSQDWSLTNSEEQDGFTILEFSRSFVSCDPQDLDITVHSFDFTIHMNLTWPPF